MYKRIQLLMGCLVCLLLCCSAANALTFDEACQQASADVGPAFFTVAEPVGIDRIVPGFIEGLSASWTYENDKLNILIDTDQTDWGTVLAQAYVPDLGMACLFPGFSSPEGSFLPQHGFGFGLDFSEKELLENLRREYQLWGPINSSNTFQHGIEIGLYDQQSRTFQPIVPGPLGIMCAWGEDGGLQVDYIIANISFTSTAPLTVQYPKVPASDIFALFDLEASEREQIVTTVKNGSVYLAMDTNVQVSQVQGEIAVAVPAEAGSEAWTCNWLNGFGDRISCTMLDANVYDLPRLSACVAYVNFDNTNEEYSHEQSGTLEWVDETGTVRGYSTFSLTVVCGQPKPWPSYIGDWHPVEASRLLIDAENFPDGMQAVYDGNGIVTVSVDPYKLPESADYSQVSLDLFVERPASDCGIRGWSQAGGGHDIYGPVSSAYISSINKQISDNASTAGVNYSVIGMNVFRTYHQHGDDVTVYTINGPTGEFAGQMVIISWWRFGQNPQTDDPYLTEYVIIRVEDCTKVFSSNTYPSDDLLPQPITQPCLVLPENSQPGSDEVFRFETRLYPQKGATARYYLMDLVDQAGDSIEWSGGRTKVYLPYPESISEEQKKQLRLIRLDGATEIGEVYSVLNGGLQLNDDAYWFWTDSFGPFLLMWDEDTDQPCCANGHPLQYFYATYGSGLAEVCTEGCHEAFVTLCDAPAVVFGADLSPLILREGEWLGEQPEVHYAIVSNGVCAEWTNNIPAEPGSYAVRLVFGYFTTTEHHFTIAEPGKMVLPSDLKKIESEAFAGGSLVYVVCPDGLEEIGSRAFADCKQLTCIVIPASVSVIADDAFEGCPSLMIAGESGSFAETFAQSIEAAFQTVDK